MKKRNFIDRQYLKMSQAQSIIWRRQPYVEVR